MAEKLIREVPDMTVATDIICGFPGETEQAATHRCLLSPPLSTHPFPDALSLTPLQDHAETLAMLQHFQFPVVNISQAIILALESLARVASLT